MKIEKQILKKYTYWMILTSSDRFFSTSGPEIFKFINYPAFIVYS